MQVTNRNSQTRVDPLCLQRGLTVHVLVTENPNWASNSCKPARWKIFRHNKQGSNLFRHNSILSTQQSFFGFQQPLNSCVSCLIYSPIDKSIHDTKLVQSEHSSTAQNSLSQNDLLTPFDDGIFYKHNNQPFSIMTKLKACQAIIRPLYLQIKPQNLLATSVNVNTMLSCYPINNIIYLLLMVHVFEYFINTSANSQTNSMS